MAERARTGARRWTWRQTNLTLLAVLVLAFASGAAAEAVGSPGGRWVVVAHGIVGLAVVLLTRPKSRVAAGGLRRRRPDRWASLTLAGLAVAVLGTGVGSATGLLGTVAGQEPLWWHIAIALTLVPVLVWHVLGRPVYPRRADLGRRAVLRAGLLTLVAAVGYAGVEGAVRLADLSGARRRFTGSHADEDLPVTMWLDDEVPLVDAGTWRLAVTDAAGSRSLSFDDLVASGTTTVRATLDCTSGWYGTRDWTGVPLAGLLSPGPEHRSVRVRSLTGYDRFLPLADLPGLLLAVESGDAPLTPGHGFPVRLVAPGRRGFWWVKWVTAVELSRRPWWAQPPFPLT